MYGHWAEEQFRMPNALEIFYSKKWQILGALLQLMRSILGKYYCLGGGRRQTLCTSKYMNILKPVRK
jgi:hypothetical protein